MTNATHLPDSLEERAQSLFSHFLPPFLLPPFDEKKRRRHSSAARKEEFRVSKQYFFKEDREVDFLL